MGYVDDIWLLSPTQDGLQEMVQLCSDYCKNLNLSFSTHLTARLLLLTEKTHRRIKVR